MPRKRNQTTKGESSPERESALSRAPEWPPDPGAVLSHPDQDGLVEQMCKMVGGLEIYAGRRTSERKWRLFMAACLRRALHVFRDARTRGLVGTVERLAEGLASRTEGMRLQKRAWNPPNPDCVEGGRKEPVSCALEALDFALEGGSYSYADAAAGWIRDGSWDAGAEQQAQAVILLCIFGNPFRPISLDPGWLSPTVASLAQAAYDERALPSGELDPARLAILSDALEEAGCADEGILAHLRSAGPHVRGCWALDLVLGKG